LIFWRYGGEEGNPYPIVIYILLRQTNKYITIYQVGICGMKKTKAVETENNSYFRMNNQQVALRAGDS
jgi:hypothetical protein